MGCERNHRFFDEPFHQRHDRRVGHGPTNLSFPQIDKDILWEGFDLQSAELIHQVISVELQELYWERNGVRPSRFRACPLGVVVAGNDLERAILNGKICMS